MFQGPIVVVADQPSPSLSAAIRAAGGTPVDARWAKAGPTILKTWPSAVVINELPGESDEPALAAIARAAQTLREPYLPIVSRVGREAGPAVPGALPLAESSSDDRVVARLASALRARALHATVFRRAAALEGEGGEVPPQPSGDPLADATVLVAGRGRTYPELTTSIGERVGLIGAMNVETAARYLNARHLDGVIIGEGFSQPMIDAFLTALSEDYRFRDLPVALAHDAPVGIDLSGLPNLERLEGKPADVVEWILPLVRLHAYEARLQRQLDAIEAKGMLDAHTGLFTVNAFARELDAAVTRALELRLAMTVARFAFLPGVGPRATLDAARLTSRLVRSVDFACRASDGSILIAFPETALRAAHIIARRVATTLKGTMLSSDKTAMLNDPIVTLAALKSSDTAETLLARVSERTAVAAE
jgi:hypothetical protein